MLVVRPSCQATIFSARNHLILNKYKEPHAFLKSAVALALIAGCLWAAQWQFHRGTERSSRNDVIESHIAIAAVPLTEVPTVEEFEWRQVTLSGRFDSSNQILLRNHYNEGVYGFELLTAFTINNGDEIWVDCGWVKAAASAAETPPLPELPQGDISITGRIRLDHSLPQGTFFAAGNTEGSALISAANAQAGYKGIDAPFYIDLINTKGSIYTPEYPAQLPELSDGPHLAYAVQWIFFGVLAGYGRYLIRREDRRSRSDSASGQ